MLWHWLFLSVAAALSVITSSHGARDLFKCPTRILKGGKVRQRNRGRVIKYICTRGFQILGDKYSTCVKGKWDTPVPFCISPGCAPISVAHSETVDTYRGALTSVHCDPGYKLVGSPTLRCDSRVWNASAPICQEISVSLQRSCDFENEDLCGWTHDHNHDFEWKRHNFATPSGEYDTGPSFDHTFGQGANGHYMYIETSSPRLMNDTARLFSPFFPTPTLDTCFIFWYHMYGVSTGTLNVYLHGKNTILLFSESGDHGNQWIQAVLPLPFYRSNFQLVIEGVRGSGFRGDTAIDDVRLAEGEDCFPTATTTYDDEATTSYNTENNSCKNRCDTALSDITLCECTADCVKSGTCCPDYLNHCSKPSSDSPDQKLTNQLITEELPVVDPYAHLHNYSHVTELSPTYPQNSTDIVGLTSIYSSHRDESSVLPQTTMDLGNTSITSRLLAQLSTAESTPTTKKITLERAIVSTKSPEISQSSHAIQYNTSTASYIGNFSIAKLFTITPIASSPAISKNTVKSSQNLITTTSLLLNVSSHLPKVDKYSTTRNLFHVFTSAKYETQSSSTSALTSYTSIRIQNITERPEIQRFDTLNNNKNMSTQSTGKPILTTSKITAQLPLFFFPSTPHLTTEKIKLPKIEFITPPSIIYRTPKKIQNQTTRFKQNLTTASTQGTIGTSSIPPNTPSTTLAPKYFKFPTKSYLSKNDVLHSSWTKKISVPLPPVIFTLNPTTQTTLRSTSRLNVKHSSTSEKDLVEEHRKNKKYQQKTLNKDAVPVHDQYAGVSPTKRKEIIAFVCVCLIILSAVLLTLGVIRRRKNNHGNSEYDTLDIHFLQPDEILDFTLSRPSQDDCEMAESVR